MKIFKEDIENVERALNGDFDAHIELSPVLADAIDDSRKSTKEIEEIVEPEKLKNKKPFLGAEKQPIPEKVEEFESVKLDESLFEDVKTIKDLSADDKNSNTVYNEEFNKKLNEQKYNEVEELPEDKYFDLKNDVFDALADVLFKYSNYNYDIPKSKFEQVLEWFLIHFYDYGAADDFDYLEEATEEGTYKQDRRLAPTSVRYKGYLIRLDRGGDGYNVYDKYRELEDAGFGSLKSAKKFVDELVEGVSSQSSVDSLEEASNLKDYSNKETKQDKERDNDLWSQVYKELCPARSSEAMETKVKMKNKKYYKDENVSVNTDGNIVVYAENEDGLELAKKVAEYYNLETKFTQSPDAFSMKYPKKQVSLTLIIPE